ncbi:putative uncharacterized protein FLJ45840 [Saccopteryx bilineata]|uniref:putative uncharacterized protein FLJ45840 n=1 Tax=Saccopteryx bilineata TaxID=59482 RepID=UPI00338E9C46
MCKVHQLRSHFPSSSSPTGREVGEELATLATLAPQPSSRPPASAPRPASSPAHSESCSPPLPLISRHITCCSCQSPGDVLLSGGGGCSGWGVGGTAVPACPPRPDFSLVTAVSILGWMEVESPNPPSSQPQGGEGRGAPQRSGASGVGVEVPGLKPPLSGLEGAVLLTLVLPSLSVFSIQQIHR